MKAKILFIIIAFTSFCNAQIINIPDANFKNALINSQCVDADLNGTYESDADLNNDGTLVIITTDKGKVELRKESGTYIRTIVSSGAKGGKFNGTAK